MFFFFTASVFLSWKIVNGKKRMRQFLYFCLLFLFFFYFFFHMKIPSFFNLFVKGVATATFSEIWISWRWMEDESVAETRVRIYKQLEKRTSQSILPDKNFMSQAIKQVYYWTSSDIFAWEWLDDHWRKCSASLVCRLRIFT